jgi:hypothetical protein
MENSFHNIQLIHNQDECEGNNEEVGEGECEGEQLGGLLLYPSSRKSNLVLNKTIHITASFKKLSFGTQRMFGSGNSSGDLSGEKFDCDATQHPMESDRKSFTTKHDYDESIYQEPQAPAFKQSVLQNLLYLYDDEVNKIKLSTDKKYSRNKTSLTELKKGMKNSVIRLNDKELTMLQSIDNNAKELKFSLIQRSVISVLGMVDDVLYRRKKAKKRDVYYNFLKFGFKNTIRNYIEKTIYMVNEEEKFQPKMTGVNYNIGTLLSSRLNKVYYEINEKLLLKIIHQDYIGEDRLSTENNFIDSVVDSDNEAERCLTTTIDSRGHHGVYIRQQPKRKSLFSYRNFFKSHPCKNIPHPMQLGYTNLTFYNKHLKQDQQEINKSLNSTKDMLNRTESDLDSSIDHYKRMNSKDNMVSSTNLYNVETPGKDEG